MSVERLLSSDRFAALLGARLVEDLPDRLEVEMDLAPHHYDASGRVSSGVLFSLADCAMSLISNAEQTAVAVATHLATAHQTPAAPRLRACARPQLPLGGRATTWLVTVTAGDATVATFTGTTLRVD